MKRTWTIIGVRDVPHSFKWYQSLFGQAATRPGHSDFGQVLDSDGTVLLCRHQWGAPEHPRWNALLELRELRGGIGRRQRQVALRGRGNGLLAFARQHVAHELPRQRGDRSREVDQ